MNSKFDAYEYIAVIAPGAVAIFGGSLVFPELKAYISNGSVTIGGLGIFVILSYIAGHLLQAFGNLLEKALWFPFGGMPTQWILKETQGLLSEKQLERLFYKIKEIDPDFDPSKTDPKSWYATTREIYGLVKDAQKAERVDSFNRNYGLLRGIATSFVISTLIALVFNLAPWKVIGLLAFSSGVALFRMYRFGVHYGRELFVRYLSL